MMIRITYNALTSIALASISIPCFALLACRSDAESSSSEGARATPVNIAREAQRSPERKSERTSAKLSPATPKPGPNITPVTAEASAREVKNEAASGSTSFRVEGVAAGDVLNIRYEPDAESTTSGSIPAGTAHVEGLGVAKTVGQATWQRVRYGGVTGWVNARFLKPNAGGAPRQVPAPSKIEALTPLVCFGAEPNWAITFGADGSAVCGSNCEPPASGLRVTKILTDRSGTPDGFDLVDADGKQWLSVVVAKTGKCSDGMSDDPYLYEFAGSGKPGKLAGCCRVKDKDEL
jgi:uncharacterized membrane protein